jgi:ssRNA-specific RNase YbeY (16S rRNA maturation enzyme)
VIFHGILHLTGYKDKMEEDVKVMREKENYYLAEVDFSEIEK